MGNKCVMQKHQKHVAPLMVIEKITTIFTPADVLITNIAVSHHNRFVFCFSVSYLREETDFQAQII